MQWSRYLLQVAANCFVLLVICIGLVKLDNHPEIITIAAIGLIYVAIRSSRLGLFVALISTDNKRREEIPDHERNGTAEADNNWPAPGSATPKR